MMIGGIFSMMVGVVLGLDMGFPYDEELNSEEDKKRSCQVV